MLSSQEVMEADAVGSRSEEGCLRFDVLCDQSNPNRFFFYEVQLPLICINSCVPDPAEAWNLSLRCTQMLRRSPYIRSSRTSNFGPISRPRVASFPPCPRNRLFLAAGHSQNESTHMIVFHF